MRTLLPLLLAGTALFAGEIPQGEMPRIDGVWSEGEWADAHVVKLAGGEARMFTSGRALCLGIRVEAPYAGERIDLYVATRSGASACVHALHPAAYLPRLPFAPLPPVLVRRGAWERLHESPIASPYGSRFRSRVLQKDQRFWTAEFVVAHEALNLPAGQPASFLVRVVKPTADEDAEPAEGPGKWPELVLRLDRDADLFETPGDDAANKLALEIFRDGLVQKTLDATFDPEAAAELADRCDAGSFHDLWFRLHILRRANRLDDARGALRKLLEGEPAAAALQPVVSERRQLLLLEHDYATLRETESGAWLDRIEGAWEQEKALRAKDRDLPVVVFETSAGPVKVALFEPDSPALARSLLDWIRAGGCKDAAASWATGGVGFAFPVPNPPKDAKPTGRRAWRGTLAYVHDPDKELRLLLTTGHVHLYRSASAIGRIVEGQDTVDRLGAGDSIQSARVP